MSMNDNNHCTSFMDELINVLEISMESDPELLSGLSEDEMDDMPGDEMSPDIDGTGRPLSPLHSCTVSPSTSTSNSPPSQMKRAKRSVGNTIEKERNNAKGKYQARHARGSSSRGATGGANPRGGKGRRLNENRDRDIRTARTMDDDSGCQQGDPVLEVYLNDEDLPPSLREMVDNIERTRRVPAMHERWQDFRMNDDSVESGDSAENFEARELFGGDSGATEFEWSPMVTFNGYPEHFQPENPGPIMNFSRPYEAFRFYWNDEILEHIVRETNRYALELKSSSTRFASNWVDTNAHEIMILFAFWLMLGVIRMPTIKSCFSTNPLLKTEIFRTLMTEARYGYLSRAVRFVDHANCTPDSSKLFFLGPIVEHLNTKFQEAYIMGQKIAINESARFGLTTFELCESATGYLWSFIIDTGKDTSTGQSRLSKSTDIVIRLMRPLLNKGYQLFTDNWFNSPLLARYLKQNKTDCIGTLPKNQNNVPALIEIVTLEKGTCVARHSGDVVVMAYQDIQPIYTISTCHGTESVQVGDKPNRPAHFIPVIIADYNAHKGVVDKKDKGEPFLIERRNREWYKKVFKRLLNVSVFNSRILVDKSSRDPVKTQAFRLALVNDIINEHLQHIPRPRARQGTYRHDILPHGRLVGRQHFIGRQEVDGGQLTTESNSNPNQRMSIGQKSCMWCIVREKRRSRTVWKCKTCNVPLCMEGCFAKFHTLP